VRLAAAAVGVHVDRREYDIMNGETRTPEFLSTVNANGRIPVLQVGEQFIPESNAAAYFISEGSNLIPTDPFEHADMLRWMFWEQYNHEPNIATLRFWMRSLGPDNLSDLQRLQMPGKRKAGNEALKLMDEHLSSREWFVGDGMTLADICLFAYTHLAGDADFDLKLYPHALEWVERMKGQPRYIPMDA
jgi:glutathione S-transferase